jgi:hypothetical protein
MARKYTSKRIVMDNFSNGMISDIIGAPNSLQHAQDVIIDRAGCIRKRGGKRLFQTVAIAGGSTASQASGGQGPLSILAPGSGCYVSGWVGSLSGIPGKGIVASIYPSSNTSSGTWTTFTEANVQQQWTTSGINFSPAQRLHNSFNITEWFPHGTELLGYNKDNGRCVRWGGSHLHAYTGATASDLRVSGALDRKGIFEVAAAPVAADSNVSGNIEPGMYINFATAMTALTTGNKNLYDNSYRIVDVKYDRCFKLTLESNVFNATASSSAVGPWIVSPFALLRARQDIFNATAGVHNATGGSAAPSTFDLSSPTGSFAPGGTSAIRSYTHARTYTSHKGRVFAGATRDGVSEQLEYSSRIRWSGLHGESDGTIYCGPSYWHPSAYQDVYPGMGGKIVGLRSLGQELVVLKEDAMFSVRGNFSTTNVASDYRVDIISNDIGIDDPRSSVVSRMGLFVANKDGLFLYNGSGPSRNILANRMEVWWRNNYHTSHGVADVPKKNTFVLSVAENRLIVHCIEKVTGGTGGLWNVPYLIYDMDKDIFTLHSNEAFRSNVAHVQASGADNDGGFTNMSIGISATGTAPKLVNWDYDYYNYTAVDADALSPLTELMTQPIPLGQDALSQGRLNNIYLNYDMSGTSGSAVVGVNFGRSNTYSEPPSASSTSSAVSASDDRTIRFPIDGIKPESAAKFTFYNSVSTSADIPKSLNIYGIGFEIEPSDVNDESV